MEKPNNEQRGPTYEDHGPTYEKFHEGITEFVGRSDKTAQGIYELLGQNNWHYKYAFTLFCALCGLRYRGAKREKYEEYKPLFVVEAAHIAEELDRLDKMIAVLRAANAVKAATKGETK